MPIVKTVKGDLLQLFREKHFDEIVHGCNCFHAMGAGIAAQVAQEFPQALEADKLSVYGSKDKLGDFTTVETECGYLTNLYTQYRLGRVKDKQELYTAIRKGFEALECAEDQDWHVGIPLIGAGIAGGDWEEIKRIINEVTTNLQITVVEYEPKKA